nr:PREDICTED: cytochrome c oxidase subunit NDUFA4 [Bemisia tabaci]
MPFMKGLTLHDLKKHPSLIPILAIIGLATAGATFYTFRLAVRNPDVSWTKYRKGIPQDEFRNKQYKFLAVEQDCENEDASKAPRIEDILKS